MYTQPWNLIAMRKLLYFYLNEKHIFTEFSNAVVYSKIHDRLIQPINEYYKI